MKRFYVEGLGFTVKPREPFPDGRPPTVLLEAMGLTLGGAGRPLTRSNTSRSGCGTSTRTRARRTAGGRVLDGGPPPVPRAAPCTSRLRTATSWSCTAHRRSYGGEVLRRVGRAMAEAGIDVLLASSPKNVAYLAGISPPSQPTVRSRHSFAVVPLEGDTDQVVIRLETGVVEKRTTADHLRIYHEFVEDPVLVGPRSSSRLWAPETVRVSKRCTSRHATSSVSKALLVTWGSHPSTN